MNNTVKKIIIFVLMGLLIGTSITQFAIAGNSIINNSINENIESVNDLRNIMLTGYWDPTGRMIAQFSTDPDLNPDGWKGENWEGRGYDIHSFFPDPDDGYSGDFEVDYQDTWEDFWAITDDIKPIAIISFGAGAGPWEIEYNARNLNSWVPDNNPPNQPTPNPPDDTVPVGYVRHSTLPVQEIADAVNDQTDIYAWVDWNGDPGAFLCEYMAYLGMWYQDIHNDSEDPFRCWEAGFIHVRSNIAVPDAEEAAEITLREVIKSIPTSVPEKPTIEGPTNGDVGVEYPYTFVSTDPEGEMVSYYIDWGDGEFEDWVGPYPSGQEKTFYHDWTEIGSYDIKAKARNINEVEGDWSDPYTVNISHPPSAPIIDGPRTGDVGVEYPYTFVSTDPDGEDVFYWIMWGDGCPAIEWLGPYASGEIVTVSHAFLRAGKITINALARDINEVEGDWGSLEVEMPRAKMSSNIPFIMLLYRFSNIFPILKILF
jgi:hypothetical protein